MIFFAQPSKRLVRGFAFFSAFLFLLNPPFSHAAKEIDFPEVYGKINDAYQGKGDQTVVIIQDAHRNYECQINTVEILNSIETKSNIPLLALEGGDGSFLTGLLAKLPNAQLNQDISMYLLKEGRLTSPEYFGIVSELAKDTELYGVEDTSLYMENLEAFKEAYGVAKDLNASFLQLEESVNGIKEKIYSSRLNDLDKTIDQYQKGDISFRDYFQKIVEQSVLNTDELSKFGQVVKQSEIFELESKINFNGLEEERSKLLNSVSQKVAANALSDLLVQSLQFKMNRISALKYHQLLWSLADQNKIPTDTFTNLKLYQEYLSKISEVSEPRLFKEISEIIGLARGKMFENEDQKELNDISKEIAFIDRLFSFRLSNEDFDDYSAHKENYRVEKLLGRLKALIEKRQLGDVYLPSELKKLDESWASFENFYSYALQRDGVMLDKTLKKMQEKQYDFAVLISGGFHTRGIAQALKVKGISYFIVTPKVMLRSAQTPYYSLLLNEKNQVEHWLEPSLAGTTQAPLQTGEKPVAYPEGQAILFRVYNILHVGTRLLDSVETPGAGITEENRAKILQESAELIGKSEDENFRIDFANAVVPRPGVLQVPVYKKDEKGEIIESYFLLSRGKEGKKAIDEIKGAQNLPPGFGDVMNSPVGDVSLSIVPRASEAAKAEKEFSAGVFESENGLGLNAQDLNQLRNTLTFGNRDFTEVQQVLSSKLEAAGIALDKEAAFKLISALFQSARSALDLSLVADLMASGIRNNMFPEANVQTVQAMENIVRLQARSAVETGKLLNYDFRDGEAKDVMAFGVDLDSIFDIKVADDDNNTVTAKFKAPDAALQIKNLLAQGHKVVFFTLTSGVKKEKIQELLRSIGIPQSVLSDEFIVDVQDVIREMKQPISEQAFNPKGENYVGKNADTSKTVTTALFNLIQERTKVDPKNIVLVASDESILKNKLAEHLVVFVKHEDDKITSFSEGMVMINEVRKILRPGTDYKPPAELIDALAKRLEQAGWDRERIEKELLGSAQTGTMVVPPHPSDAADYLNDIDQMEDIVVGQAA